MTSLGGKKFLGWSLWIATIATVFIYTFLLLYFHFLTRNKIVGFSAPSFLLLVLSILVEIGILAASLLIRKSRMRAFMKTFIAKDTETIGLALSSSATLWTGFDTTPELQELWEDAQLKGYLMLWVGADFIAIFGLILALVQRNIFYFLPALLISLIFLLKFRPRFDMVRQ